tara:strand:+ start:437 stop:895 length:459 start_codon:yes stop_codon:yes gene_type:complete
MFLFSLTLFATMATATTVLTHHLFCEYQWFHYLLTSGPPIRFTPGKLCAPLAVPSGFFGCTIFGNLGAFVPDLPGVPVYDFLNLSGPAATCGFARVAMLPALVAPGVACSCTLRMITSLIFIVDIYKVFGCWNQVIHVEKQPNSMSFCAWRV